MKLRLALVGAALAATLTACHERPDLVCQYFSRPDYTAVQSYWSVDNGRYDCLSVNFINGRRDSFWVYEVRAPDGRINFIRID